MVQSVAAQRPKPEAQAASANEGRRSQSWFSELFQKLQASRPAQRDERPPMGQCEIAPKPDGRTGRAQTHESPEAGRGVCTLDQPGATTQEAVRSELGELPERRGRHVEEPGEPGSDGMVWPDVTDPLARSLAMLQPRASGHFEVSRAPIADQVALQIVRRISAGGDGRRGVVRLELGGEHLAGASVEVRSDGDGVSVFLQGNGGVDAADLAARIRKRLELRGLRVDRVEHD